LKIRLLAFSFFILVSGLTPATLLAQEKPAGGDLAKQSQNPVGNLISVPIEFWHHESKDVDASANLIIAKPVYPVNIGSLNLINRFIVPYIGLDADFSGDIPDINLGGTGIDESGLGNIQYTGFFSPATPGKVIWGVGPVFEFPTHTKDILGSDKFSAGVSAVVLSMPGNWVVGMLVQNLWSLAGDSQAADVNKFTFQYFLNYNLDKGWYLTTAPTITADWEKPSSERWSVPWGGGVGRLVKFGKQPVDFKLQYYGYSEGNLKNSAMFSVKFLFPK